MTFNYKILNLLLIILIASCSEPKTTNEQIAEAQSFLAEDKQHSAMIVLKNIIKKEPANGEARFILGKIYLNISDSTSAMKEFNKAIELKYSSEELYLLLAKHNLNEGNFDEALSLLNDNDFNTESNKITFYVLHSQIQLALGNVTDAEGYFELANKINENASEVILLKAIIFSYNQKDDEALLILNALSQEENTPPDVWLLKGSIESKINDFANAAKSFQSFSKLKPQHFNAKSLAAHNLIRAGDYEKAQTIVDDLLTITSQHPTVNLLAAQLALIAKNYDVAKEHANNVLMSTNNGLAQIISGLSDYNLGNYEQSYYQLNAIEDALPPNHKVHQILAILQLKLGYTDELHRTLENISSAETGDLIAEIGVNLAEQGNIQGANKLLERAISISPNNAQTQVKKGLLKILNSDLSGLDNLEYAIELSPELKEANVALALTYLKQGELVKATEISESWLSKNPNNVNALLLRGNIAIKTDQLEVAKKHIEKAIEIAPLNVTPLYNLAVIYTNEMNDKASIQTLYKLLEMDQEYSKAYRLLITNAIRLNDEGGLIDKLLNLTNEYPDAVWPRIVLSRRFNNTKQYNKANKILEAHNKYETLPDVYFATLANNYLTQKNFTKIDDLFTSWQNSQPNNPRAYTMYIELLDLQKKYKEALNAVSNALSTNKLKANFQLRAFESYFLLLNNQLEQAEEKANQLMKIKPSDGFLLRIKGQINLANKNHSEAIKYLSKSLAKTQNTYTALYLATAYKQKGDLNSAIQLIESELTKFSNNVIYQKFLAELYLTSSPEKAIQLYISIVNKNQNDVITMNNLAWLLYQNDKLDLALTYATKSREIAPNHPLILDTLGVIQFKNNHIEEAFSTLNEAYLISPNDAEIIIHLAQIQKARNNNAAVDKLLTTLSEQDKQKWQNEIAKLLL
jgi:putative PEP-CTERM system TPR-repeat lipoprotein